MLATRNLFGNDGWKIYLKNPNNNSYLMTAMLKTSGYFSYLPASARQQVGMVQRVGKETAFLHLLVGEENSFLT